MDRDDLERLRRVRDRIDRAYAQPLDVEALARDAHVSAGHLSRRFKEAYGESPCLAKQVTRPIRQVGSERASIRNREAPTR